MESVSHLRGLRTDPTSVEAANGHSIEKVGISEAGGLLR